jgi:hypothetical protein
VRRRPVQPGARLDGTRDPQGDPAPGSAAFAERDAERLACARQRYDAQVFAEAGYLAVLVNGTHPVSGAPDVQRNVNGGLVLEWLASDASGEVGDDAHLTRVAMAATRKLRRRAELPGGPAGAHDPGLGRRRRHRDANTSQPIMYQRTDGAC